VLKKPKQLTFEEALAALRGYKFDVSSPQIGSEAAGGNRRPAGAMQVAKYGCAAIVAAGTSSGIGTGYGTGPSSGIVTVVKPGVVLNGEIGHVLDRGYQKFIRTPSRELPATAEYLKALHKFSEELTQATGGVSLYNEAMGAVSDEYIYDRVKGRNLPESQRPVPAWEKPVGPGTPGEVKSG